MQPFWAKGVASWVQARVPHTAPFDPATIEAMGVEHRGELVAGFVFFNWDPITQTIEVAGASEHPRWATKDVVRCALDYVFDTCGCQMLYCRQHFDNLPARRGWLHLGAYEVVIPRMFGRDTIGTVITLTDDQWRASKIGRRAGDGRGQTTAAGTGGTTAASGTAGAE